MMRGGNIFRRLGGRFMNWVRGRPAQLGRQLIRRNLPAATRFLTEQVAPAVIDQVAPRVGMSDDTTQEVRRGTQQIGRQLVDRVQGDAPQGPQEQSEDILQQVINRYGSRAGDAILNRLRGNQRPQEGGAMVRAQVEPKNAKFDNALKNLTKGSGVVRYYR